jgi:Tir chaperone protein (CesT) family
MTQNPTHADSFSRLLQDFAAHSGHVLDEEMFGLEFEHQDLQATVLPHPRDAQRLILEITLGELDFGDMGAPDQALLLLHQLNDRARREHDWVITVDEQSVLTLSQIQSVAGLDGAGLQALLDQGLACAQALQSIWQAMVEGGGQAQADSDLAAQSGAGFLRA